MTNWPWTRRLHPVHLLKWSPAVTISFSPFFFPRKQSAFDNIWDAWLSLLEAWSIFLKIKLYLGDYKRKGKGKEGKTTHHLINQRSAKGRIAGYWLDNMSFCEPIYAVWWICLCHHYLYCTQKFRQLAEKKDKIMPSICIHINNKFICTFHLYILFSSIILAFYFELLALCLSIFFFN